MLKDTGAPKGLRMSSQLGSYSGKGRKITPLLFPMTIADPPRLREVWTFNVSTAFRWASRPLARPPPPSQDGEKQRPFVLLNRHLCGGRSSAYAPSRSYLIIKFARKTKPSLNANSGTRTTHTVSFTAHPTVVTCCYGDHMWYGGWALVLSDEGPSSGWSSHYLGS